MKLLLAENERVMAKTIRGLRGVTLMSGERIYATTTRVLYAQLSTGALYCDRIPWRGES